jgi:hypothetical protein
MTPRAAPIAPSIPANSHHDLNPNRGKQQKGKSDFSFETANLMALGPRSP